MKRSSGILMAVSSLPSPYGIGTLGKAAYDFADFLKDAGQSYWQMLPLGPTSYGDSPYQSFSAYAGNPYYIDPDILAADGLLTAAECAAPDWGRACRGAGWRRAPSPIAGPPPRAPAWGACSSGRWCCGP